MKKIFFILLILILASACAAPRGEKGDSIQGIPGERGPVGEAGSDGRDGVDGTDGRDAAQVTVIKLCTNITPNPVALCIDSKLYIGSGDGLQELPLGTYDYKDGNKKCTFTVNYNCVVTH